jgi:hypothetical protein
VDRTSQEILPRLLDFRTRWSEVFNLRVSCTNIFACLAVDSQLAREGSDLVLDCTPTVGQIGAEQTGIWSQRQVDVCRE